MSRRETKDLVRWAVGVSRPLGVRAAAECARSVLPIFEARRPNDDRPSKAIDVAHAWARGEMSDMTAVAAANAAANAAYAAASAAYSDYSQRGVLEDQKPQIHAANAAANAAKAAATAAIAATAATATQAANAANSAAGYAAYAANAAAYANNAAYAAYAAYDAATIQGEDVADAPVNLMGLLRTWIPAVAGERAVWERFQRRDLIVEVPALPFDPAWPMIITTEGRETCWLLEEIYARRGLTPEAHVLLDEILEFGPRAVRVIPQR